MAKCCIRQHTPYVLEHTWQSAKIFCLWDIFMHNRKIVKRSMLFSVCENTQRLGVVLSLTTRYLTRVHSLRRVRNDGVSGTASKLHRQPKLSHLSGSNQRHIRCLSRSIQGQTYATNPFRRVAIWIRNRSYADRPPPGQIVTPFWGGLPSPVASRTIWYQLIRPDEWG